MRIGLDTTALSFNLAGESRYTLSLLAALDALRGVEVRPLTLSQRHPSNVRQRVAYQAAAELLYYPLGIARHARREGVELIHHPRPQVPPELGLTTPMVVTVHDLLALSFPEHFSAVIARRFAWLAGRCAARAARVITDSEFVRAQVVERLAIPAERTAVVPLGVDERFRPMAVDADWLKRRFGIDRPYVLCVGTLEPRKNLLSVVAALERLRWLDDAITLVAVGGRGWKTTAIDAKLADAPVIATGRVEDDDLVKLYAGAACFVFPSFGEGFGLPVLEAMACGAPVVTSDRTSLPEVAGDAALLVDPGSVEAIGDAIERVVRDPALASRLEARGRERASRFSWRRCAEETVAVYRDALASAG